MFACVTSGFTTPGVRTASARRSGPWSRPGIPKAATASRTAAARTSASRTRRGCAGCAHYARRSFGLGRGLGESLDLAPFGEPPERLCLDLPDALPRETERAADLLERFRIRVAVHPVAELHDLPLPVGEGLDGATDGLLRKADVQLLGRLGLLAGEEVAELRVSLVPDGLVEARDRAGGGLHLFDVLERQLRLFRDLLVGWRSLEPRRQLPLGARDLLLALDDVDGDANRPRLVGDAALHRLADPPGRVGRELVAAAPVELLDRADQPDDPLLDQIEQGDSMALVLLRDRDDQAEIRVDHQILRLFVAPFDPLGELDLLLGGQKLVPPGLVEEELECVGRRHGEVGVDVDAVRGVGPRAVVGERDVSLLELLEEARDLLLVEIRFLQELVDGRQVETAGLLALLEQRLKSLVDDHSVWLFPQPQPA